MIPIVCVADDLVGSGLATSLAKPGSNMTGVSILATELDAKKIELLRELLPEAKRFWAAVAASPQSAFLCSTAPALARGSHSVDLAWLYSSLGYGGDKHEPDGRR
jgi:putative ABC transport system substrate-binding protein